MQVFLRRTFSPFNHQSQESKLYLIFEFLTMDLKQYMDTQCGSKDQPMQPQLVKSWIYQLCQVGIRFWDGLHLHCLIDKSLHLHCLIDKSLHCLINNILNGVNTGHRILSLEEGVA